MNGFDQPRSDVADLFYRLCGNISVLCEADEWKDAREAGLEFRNQRVFQRFLFADVFQLIAKKRKEHVLPEQVCAIFAVAFRNDLAERLRAPDPATETDEVRDSKLVFFY